VSVRRPDVFRIRITAPKQITQSVVVLIIPFHRLFVVASHDADVFCECRERYVVGSTPRRIAVHAQMTFWRCVVEIGKDEDVPACSGGACSQIQILNHVTFSPETSGKSVFSRRSAKTAEIVKNETFEIDYSASQWKLSSVITILYIYQ
jgi:hypothetical protein